MSGSFATCFVIVVDSESLINMGVSHKGIIALTAPAAILYLSLGLFSSEFAYGSENKRLTFDPSHRAWNRILGKYGVRNDSKFYLNYALLKTEPRELDLYLSSLFAVTEADFKNFTANQRTAFLVNSYHSLTVRLILDYYPVKRFSEIERNGNTAPRIPFFLLLGRLRTLEELTAYIKKQSPEPYIYFALACGSFRCPPPQLAEGDFISFDLQLELAGKDFLKRRLKRNSTNDELSVLLPSKFRALIGDFAAEREMFERYLSHVISSDLGFSTGQSGTNVQIQYERGEEQIINDSRFLAQEGARPTPTTQSFESSTSEKDFTQIDKTIGTKQWVGSTTETMDSVKRFGNAPQGSDKPQVTSNPGIKYVPAPPIKEYVERKGSGTERGSTTEYGSGTESNAAQGR